MFYLNPEVLTWTLIGASSPLLLGVIVIATVVSVASIRGSFHGKTIALLAIFGLMVIQSLQLILSTPDIKLFKPTLLAVPLPVPSRIAGAILSSLIGLNLWFARLGCVAAVILAAYLYFGRTSLNITQLYNEATPVEPSPQLLKTVADLASRATLRCPEVRLIDSGIPLAFTARSRRTHVIVLSVGLMDCFDAKEVEACLVHEIAHLKNKDFTYRSLATVAKVALFARPLSYIIEPAIYRAGEFQADKTATKLIGGPAPLISVLRELHESSSPRSPSPCFSSGRAGLLNVFNKHPPLDARIRLLEKSLSA